MSDAMEIDHALAASARNNASSGSLTAEEQGEKAAALHSTEVVEEEEEDVEGLEAMMDGVRDEPRDEAKIPLLLNIIDNTEEQYSGPKATQLKERAVYDLTRAYCAIEQYEQVVAFLTSSEFLKKLNKAKTAKVVRQVLDIVCTAAPTKYAVQESVARSIVSWTEREKRSFLRQRVQAKLCTILFHQQKYSTALDGCDALLHELKKLDDKQLLVETHLLESKIHFALRNVPKAKAALTASRTAANAIYVSPAMQAEIDTMSGTIHTEEGDYNTAHSYFLEAFEQLDQMNDDEAIVALKYMMLCRILDSLRVALKMSKTATVSASSASGGGVGGKAEDVLTSGLLTGKQGIKYAGRETQALSAVAEAANHRNLREFESVLKEYADELQKDLLISHHLQILHEQLLESNLIRIVEPYSCVELQHVADKMELPLLAVERKLSQMILDGKLVGIIDQGKGHLLVYEESEKDVAMEKGLQVLANMDAVVTSLFDRSKQLRTMMM